MGFIHTSDTGGFGPLHVTATPEIWLFASVNLPLMFLTLAGWYCWEKFSHKKAQRVAMAETDVEKVE